MPEPARPPVRLRSARLDLRPVGPGDLEAMLAYRGVPEVCTFLPFEPMTREVLAARLEGDLARTGPPVEGDWITFAVVVREPGDLAGQLVGDVVLFNRSAEHRGGEIGWVLRPGATGRGYATEAAAAVLAWAFAPGPDGMEMHRVVARLDGRNTRSAALAERLGMRREAHFVRNEWFKGEWTDEVVYAVLAEEWPRERPGGRG